MEYLDQRIPVPNCCDAMKKHRSVHLQMSRGFYFGETKEPRWVTSAWNSQYECRSEVQAFFCPFCGTPVPELEKRASSNTRYMRITDGGYYCDTCKERANACTCSPPQAEWRPKPQTMKKLYYQLSVTASSEKTKIWVSDKDGFLVVSDYGRIKEGLFPGTYRIRFRLENEVDFEIDLQADTELTEANIRDFTREIVSNGM